MANLSVNKVIICGKLCADPEQRQTATGTPVTTFRVAVNRKISNDPSQPKADFFSVVAWQKTAEFVARYFTKGASIFVEGRLQERQWTDQQGGKRNAVEIVAEDVRFVDGKAEAKPDEPAASEQKLDNVPLEDDLPF